jgi:hypothetical protein
MAKPRKSSNRSRRRQQRAATRPQAPRPASPAMPEFEAAEREETVTSAAARTTTTRASTAVARGTRAGSRLTVAGPSALSERAIQEYHYVGRDLRNIFTLVIIMAVLLGIAFVAFTALGIGHTT